MVSEMEDVVSIYKVNFGPQLPHASSFIKSNNNKGFTTKEENDTVIYSIYNENGELSSRGLNISPMNKNMNIYNIYNVWQPSLVLGRPARALTGPYSLRRLYTGLGTPSLLRHKYTSPQFGSFKERSH